MDLTDRVQDAILALNLPVDITQGYLSGKEEPEIKLYSLPGSTVLEADFAGNRTEKYNFEIAMRAQDQEQVNQVLYEIAKFISSDDFKPESQDHSFEFDSADIAGFPHITSVDVQGNAIYVLDFTITVDVMKGEK